jgi:UDP-2-acetamido-3-amino-2,3-dideoxy-glucuronate N-acetyltransferase
MAHVPQRSFPRIAVVGAGYWGKNLIRSFHQLGALHTICDTRTEILATFQTLYPDATLEPSFEQLLSSTEVDAVVRPHLHLRIIP